ncbi:MAG: outer membrane beta-barrel domain-containing protein [Pseudomonadota bacterium]|nr:outer membrane beta-barrel domain-containing protein [Pseudomonadota bacterium]
MGLAAAFLAAPFTAFAADPPKPAGDQVVVPEVDRREIKIPKFPSNDFEMGLFGGTYATQNFGASAVGGIRLGYHITEDFFVEGVYAYTKVSDEDFRLILPGGVFPKPSVNVLYYNLSVGYNVLPGEIFFFGKRAKASAIYLITGVGSTKFDQQRRPTFNAGFGLRVFPADWMAVQFDVRDHVYSLDLLGKRQTTQNIELTGGLTFFF